MYKIYINIRIFLQQKYRIDILPEGPYLVYGNPPLKQEILSPNEEGETWRYVEGKSFAIDGEPTALCRCGHSRRHPYCDGSHVHTEWDASLAPAPGPLLEDAHTYRGKSLQMEDNPAYCVHARICMADKAPYSAVG